MEARLVAGVDGCRAGWVVVLRDLRGGACRARVVANFAAIMTLPEAPLMIAIDVPIGLPDSATPGGRACDALARRRLPGRAASVFSPPTRRALAAFRAGHDHARVSAENRGGVAIAPGLSRQTFHILPKIHEVDAQLTPSLQLRVREVHPELSFAEANGGAPLKNGKKTPAGERERVALLRRAGFASPAGLLGSRLPRGVLRDDLLDACIACWTAERIVTGVAIVEPSSPPVDARGLHMGIWR